LRRFDATIRYSTGEIVLDPIVPPPPVFPTRRA
jgi:hypothetical protein